jgi:adenylate cyclase
VTNLASRLCSEAKGGQIVTNQKTLARIEDSAQVEPLGELTLKGVAQPVKAFNITGFDA